MSSAFYSYDVNGNVGQLVATSGGLLARYEYSSFGEIVVQEPYGSRLDIRLR